MRGVWLQVAAGGLTVSVAAGLLVLPKHVLTPDVLTGALPALPRSAVHAPSAIQITPGLPALPHVLHLHVPPRLPSLAPSTPRPDLVSLPISAPSAPTSQAPVPSVPERTFPRQPPDDVAAPAPAPKPAPAPAPAPTPAPTPSPAPTPAPTPAPAPPAPAPPTPAPGPAPAPSGPGDQPASPQPPASTPAPPTTTPAPPTTPVTNPGIVYVTLNPTRQQLTGPIAAQYLDPANNPPVGRDLNQGGRLSSAGGSSDSSGDGSAGQDSGGDTSQGTR